MDPPALRAFATALAGAAKRASAPHVPLRHSFATAFAGAAKWNQRRICGSSAGVEEGRAYGVEAESGVPEPSACVRNVKRVNPGSVLTEELSARGAEGHARPGVCVYEFPFSCWGEGCDNLMGNAEQIKK